MRWTFITLAFCAVFSYTGCAFLEELKAAAVINIRKYPPPVDKLKTLQALIKSKAFLPPEVFEKLLEKYNRESAEIGAEKLKYSSTKGKEKMPEVEKNVRFLLPDGQSRNVNRKTVGKSVQKESSSSERSDSAVIELQNYRKLAVSDVENRWNQKMNERKDSSKYYSLPISSSSENMDHLSEDRENDLTNDTKGDGNCPGAFKNLFTNLLVKICGGNKKNYDCPELIYDIPPSENSENIDVRGKQVKPVDGERVKPTLSEEDICLLTSTILVHYLYEAVGNFDNVEKKVALQMDKVTGARNSLSLWIDKYARNTFIKNAGRVNVVSKKYRLNELHSKAPPIENLEEEFQHLCEVALKNYFGDELIVFSKSSKLKERKKNIGVCQLSFKTGDIITLLIEKSITPAEGYFISVLLSVNFIQVVDFVKLSEEPQLQNKNLVVGAHLLAAL